LSGIVGLPDGADAVLFLQGDDIHRTDLGAGAAGDAIRRRFVEGGGEINRPDLLRKYLASFVEVANKASTEKTSKRPLHQGPFCVMLEYHKA
jgi:hypothetical protein